MSKPDSEADKAYRPLRHAAPYPVIAARSPLLLRRIVLASGLGAALNRAAQAQAWPARSIRYIVPFAPGGSTDSVSRLLAEQLSRVLGQQIVVENRPGAGSTLGTAELAHAPPDGYTIGLITAASHSINPALYAALPYDPERDLVAISLFASVPSLLTVTTALPAGSVPELIALLKAAPGRYSYASAGIGSSLHLAGELFKAMAGVDMVHVPYKGTSAALPDVITGRVHLMFANAPGALTQIRAGHLRGLAVTSAGRSRTAPDYPAIAEFLPGYVATTWYGIAVPEATPASIIEQLEAATTEVMSQPGTQARWLEMGLDIPLLGRSAAAAFIAEDRARWATVVKASGARIE